MGAFLEPEDIVRLTGRKTKTRQIDELKRQGIPFFVNATGHPVVARAIVEGRKDNAPEKVKWQPRLLMKA